jgi:hypothetical protein
MGFPFFPNGTISVCAAPTKLPVPAPGTTTLPRAEAPFFLGEISSLPAGPFGSMLSGCYYDCDDVGAVATPAFRSCSNSCLVI